MSDEVILQGKTYVSSKRAADETGYARDYIGQLSRAGLIDAERVGGLWYVSLESLRGYEKNADSAKMISAVSSTSREAESMISFEGKDYISASRASKVSGYNQDYVGQLARAGKIPSRQIGNRWYVDRDALQQHKSEKDALLAAVQSEATGLKAAIRPVHTPPISRIHVQDIRYSRDDRDLMPVIAKGDLVGTAPLAPIHATPDDAAVLRLSNVVVIPTPLVPSPIAPDIRPVSLSAPRKSMSEKPLIPLRPRNSGKYLLRGGIGALTIILVMSLGFVGMKSGATLTEIDLGTMSASASGALQGAGDLLEDLVSPELTYERGR